MNLIIHFPSPGGAIGSHNDPGHVAAKPNMPMVMPVMMTAISEYKTTRRCSMPWQADSSWLTTSIGSNPMAVVEITVVVDG
jgi:hypothetical protein